MVIMEIFDNPIVKQVIFEIKFPNLFYIENKIGDLQMKIMEIFPESALFYRRQLLFADMGPKGKLEQVKSKDEYGKPEEEFSKKVWEFKSEKGFRLSITSNSLSIISEFHKTYNLGDSDKFRDIIEFSVGNFFDVAKIPILNRIGLRYIDECPIPTKNNETFKLWYKSVFPVDRFNLADTEEMFFRTLVKRGDYKITYMEALKRIKNEYKLILDFDGFGTKIKSDTYLTVTDELHKIISEEYENTINKPVFDYMKRKD